MPGDFRLGSWVVRPSLNTIERNGQKLRLEPKVAEVLVCLAEHAGETVPKEQLIKAIWGDTFVTDDVLTRCISELRRALEDDPKQPRFIVTIPKRGYRLVGKAEPSGPRRKNLVLILLGIAVGVAAFVAGAVGLWPHSPSIQSVAVLPFRNFSGDSAQEFIADGVTDVLITDLAQISSLRVISWTSAAHYKGSNKSLPEIAKELNVDAVVEGTVSRSGNRVRVTAQLIYAPADRHIWTQNYERDLANVLGLQGEIAVDIARQVSAVLTSREQLRFASSARIDPEAQEDYLRGRYLLNLRGRENLLKAPEYFQLAVGKDPNFAEAYASLAESYGTMAAWGLVRDQDVAPKIREAAFRAVQLDENSSTAHAALASYFCGQKDKIGVEREVRRALEINPNNSMAHKLYGLYLHLIGQFDAAITEESRAQDLDPLAAHLSLSLGHVLYDSKQYDRALEQWRRAMELDSNLHFLHLNIGWAYAHQGMHDKAVKEWLHHWQHAPRVVAVLKKAYETSGYRGYLRAQLDRDLANALLPEHVSDYQSNYQRAIIYGELGDLDHAFGALTAAMQHQEPDMEEILVDPDLDTLRSDGRFPELVRRCRSECGMFRPF